jgi:hypothetical protein
MKKDFVTGLNVTFNKIIFGLKKHSPQILIVAGVAGTITGAVMACKATTKISDILDKTKDDVKAIHDCLADESLAEEYTKENANKDLVIVYAQTGVKLAKLYAPAISVGIFSLGCILTSHGILSRRTVALAAAYSTIDRGFKEYRNRVVERFGKEVERELKYNIKAKTFEEPVIDEKGKEKNIKTTVNIAYPDSRSSYARFFDSTSYYWEKDSSFNLTFLRQQEQYANDRLRATGRLFLNEVYQMLDIPKTKEGQIVGWVYDPDNPIGDNYVDFGIYDIYSESNRRFVNGYEPVILLDFNVDGNIWDMM